MRFILVLAVWIWAGPTLGFSNAAGPTASPPAATPPTGSYAPALPPTDASAASPAPQSRNRGRSRSAEDTIIIGATTDNYPYSYLDTDGQLKGFAIDLTDAIARVMHLRTRRVGAPARELHDRFTHLDEFDFLQVYSQTPERELYADFSSPFLHLQGALFVTKTPQLIRQLSDLNGQNFAIIGKASIGERFLADQKIKARIVHVTSAEEALRWVDSGRVAAVFVSQLTAFSVLERVGLNNVVMWGTPVAGYDVRHCLAVHEGDSELLSRLNEGLWLLNQRGEYSAIYNKWFGHFNTPIFTREQLVRYSVAALAVGLVIAMLALLRQLILSRRIARQAHELRQQRELLHAIYDNVPTGLTVIEIKAEDVRVISLNREAARIYGLDRQLTDSCPLAQLPCPPEVLSHLETIAQLVRQRDFQRREYALPSAALVLEVMAVPLAAGAEPIARFCIFAADITERKRLDAEVAQSRKLLAVGELVGGIAHEFNNLLTPILFTVTELQNQWRHDAALQEEVNLIAQASKRAADLTRRLLTFGRRSDGKLEQVYLQHAVEGSCALLRPTMDRRVQWETEIPSQLGPVLFNTTDLHQILLNLLLNARDTLMEKLGRAHPADWQPRIGIAIAAFPPDANTLSRSFPDRQLLGWQRLTVRDNGLGIPSQVLDRIYDPFFTTKEVGKGTGLGLATVWHLAATAGGRIEVQTQLGEGSLFHLWIPVWPNPRAEKAAAPVAPAAPASPPSTAAGILLVEDETLVARSLITALQREGHRVTHYLDGAQAWADLSVHPLHYALLIVDNNLPGLSGAELIERARQRAFTGRIIVMSGRIGDEEKRSFRQMQVDGVIAKPFDLAQLLELVRRTLGQG